MVDIRRMMSNNGAGSDEEEDACGADDGDADNNKVQRKDN